jgi:hypothetical protein
MSGWTPSHAVREVQELIAALDRRVPQVQRAGEVSIAREAAALKVRALKRLEELEREEAAAEGRECGGLSSEREPDAAAASRRLLTNNTRCRQTLRFGHDLA